MIIEFLRELGLKLLCLSNGHGEDAIALRILQELQQHPHPPELAVFPLVGEGQAFAQLENARIIGPVQRMPSGGFIYMDGREFLRDVKGGLLQLTIAQFKAIRAWVRTQQQSGNQDGVILACGDIVPLLFAWLSGAPYAFVGTAKSEYYLRGRERASGSQIPSLGLVGLPALGLFALGALVDDSIALSGRFCQGRANRRDFTKAGNSRLQSRKPDDGRTPTGKPSRFLRP